ncbi:MAG: LD-carboxypeptidase [Urechidicola sp.]|nr:LD-carboxypeptidase [Urechidicola sp.]
MQKYFLISVVFLFYQIAFSASVSLEKNSIQPPHLKKGDTILILAPAGKIKGYDAIKAGVELANKWGLVVTYGNHLYSQQNTFAGTDTQRLEDLQKGLDNQNIKMIWSARGGYGLVRIVDDLDFTKFKQHPKWVVGYSDVSVLHNKIHNLGYQTIHGQMPLTLDLADEVQAESINSLYQSLFGKKLKYKLGSSDNNRLGKSEGQLVGGNLSILYSMLGSDTNLDTDGKILFIEDVGEALYHIDRMMISLKRAGYFKNCKGLIVGDFRLKKNEGNKFGLTLEEIILEAVEGTDFPVIFNFPAGHVDDNRALILGATAELNVKDKKVKIVFE